MQWLIDCSYDHMNFSFYRPIDNERSVEEREGELQGVPRRVRKEEEDNENELETEPQTPRTKIDNLNRETVKEKQFATGIL